MMKTLLRKKMKFLMMIRNIKIKKTEAKRQNKARLGSVNKRIQLMLLKK